MSRLSEMLERHEGRRPMPYRDTKGHETVGVGHNLDAKPLEGMSFPLSEMEIELIFAKDLQDAAHFVRTHLPWVSLLDQVRQDAVVDMAFNLEGKLLGFRKFLAALAVNDWTTAAAEMLDSLWEKQVGDRAHELAYMIETGQYRET